MLACVCDYDRPMDSYTPFRILKEGTSQSRHTSNYKGIWASPVAQLAKNRSAIQETWVQSLGWEDPLEKGTATHSSFLAWRIPWMCSPWGCRESDTTERLALNKLIPF